MLLKKLRGDSVGSDHEVFDQLLGPVLPFQSQIHDLAVPQHGFGLDGLKVQRAVHVV